jgi:hypothetical protein
MTAEEWLKLLCDRLGVDVPDQRTVEDVLAIAGSAAHASERTAAPVATYLIGRSGLSVTAALELVNDLS